MEELQKRPGISCNPKPSRKFSKGLLLIPAPNVRWSQGKPCVTMSNAEESLWSQHSVNTRWSFNQGMGLPDLMNASKELWGHSSSGSGKTLSGSFTFLSFWVEEGTHLSFPSQRYRLASSPKYVKSLPTKLKREYFSTLQLIEEFLS